MLFSILGRAVRCRRAQRRTIARLAAALHSLPDPQRTVYVMCAVERCPQPAVAAALGISVAEVQERLTAALVALATIIKQDTAPAVASDDPHR